MRGTSCGNRDAVRDLISHISHLGSRIESHIASRIAYPIRTCYLTPETKHRSLFTDDWLSLTDHSSSHVFHSPPDPRHSFPDTRHL